MCLQKEHWEVGAKVKDGLAAERSNDFFEMKMIEEKDDLPGYMDTRGEKKCLVAKITLA